MDYVSFIRSKVGHEKIMLDAAGCIIVNDEGKVLLQKRGDDGNWGLIGGILELGETYQQAAIREAKEETGLDVEITELQGMYINFDRMWPNGDLAQANFMIFIAKPITNTLIIDNVETLDLKYFSLNELPYIAEHTLVTALEDYKNGKRNVIL